MAKVNKALKMVGAMVDLSHEFRRDGKTIAADIMLKAAQDLPSTSLERLYDIIKEA